MIFDPLGPFLAGVLVIALAASCIGAAAIEPPPATRVPRTAMTVGSLWAACFIAAAAVVLLQFGNIEIFGLLVAAAEIVIAGVIWALRGGPREDGRGDDGGDDDGPRVPPEYWARWEASLRPAGVRRHGPTGP